jgi:S-adenosylmethionine synthetase
VDRSAAATRHIAKNLVAAGVADEILVQVSYAIGVKPMGIFIDTWNVKTKLKRQLLKKVEAIFDMRPYFIEQRLKLRNLSIVKLQLTDIWDVHRNGYKTFSAQED